MFRCCRHRTGKPFGRLTDEDLERYMRLAVSEYLAVRTGPEAHESHARELLKIFMDLLPYELGIMDRVRVLRFARDKIGELSPFDRSV